MTGKKRCHHNFNVENSENFYPKEKLGIHGKDTSEINHQAFYSIRE